MSQKSLLLLGIRVLQPYFWKEARRHEIELTTRRRSHQLKLLQQNWSVVVVAAVKSDSAATATMLMSFLGILFFLFLQVEIVSGRLGLETVAHQLKLLHHLQKAHSSLSQNCKTHVVEEGLDDLPRLISIASIQVEVHLGGLWMVAHRLEPLHCLQLTHSPLPQNCLVELQLDDLLLTFGCKELFPG